MKRKNVMGDDEVKDVMGNDGVKDVNEGDFGDFEGGGDANCVNEDKDVDASSCASKIEELESKVAELTGDLQRTRADFENFRKQVEIQKANERKMMKFATVEKMLPLLDNLDLAILSYKELAPLNKSLEKVMKNLGLKKIAAEVGTEFEPDLHEAVMAEGDGDNEMISEVLRPGYYYEGEVLRPAMVKVKKA